MQHCAFDHLVMKHASSLQTYPNVQYAPGCSRQSVVLTLTIDLLKLKLMHCFCDHHHHHVTSKPRTAVWSVAVSTSCLHRPRSWACRHAEFSPWLSGWRSVSRVRTVARCDVDVLGGSCSPWIDPADRPTDVMVVPRASHTIYNSDLKIRVLWTRLSTRLA